MTAANGNSDVSDAADDRITGALPFNIQTCTSKGNCKTEIDGLEINYSWRCPDPRTCYNVNNNYYTFLNAILNFNFNLFRLLVQALTKAGVSLTIPVH